MSVIVKGMKLPVCCWDCPLLKYETNFIVVCPVTGRRPPYYEFIRKREDGCPLEEVNDDETQTSPIHGDA